MIISLIFSGFINWLLKPPQEIKQWFEFSFDDKGKTLKTEMNVNCYNTYEKNCIYLEKNIFYNVYLNLDLMRNQAYQKDKYKNFEVQLIFQGKIKYEKFKKVVFVERYDYFIELFYDIFYFPFRLFSFMNTNNLKIKFMDSFDNHSFYLEKVEIILTDILINVKHANFYLFPQIGWITYFFGVLRFFIVPFIFLFSIITQLLFYFGIRIILKILKLWNRKETNHNINNLPSLGNLEVINPNLITENIVIRREVHED